METLPLVSMNTITDAFWILLQPSSESWLALLTTSPLWSKGVLTKGSSHRGLGKAQFQVLYLKPWSKPCSISPPEQWVFSETVTPATTQPPPCLWTRRTWSTWKPVLPSGIFSLYESIAHCPLFSLQSGESKWILGISFLFFFCMFVGGEGCVCVCLDMI